jgi:hypothetical protein
VQQAAEMFDGIVAKVGNLNAVADAVYSRWIKGCRFTHMLQVRPQEMQVWTSRNAS